MSWASLCKTVEQMSDFSAGQRIGGYEVLGILGKGGMGTVYKANQTSMDRIVALKVLDPALAKKDPSFCERFIDEARAAGRLNHPNIIGVHDVSNVDVEGQTIYYFSMEVVEGDNFKELIEKDGPIQLKIMEQVALKISDALLYAEQMNIVHRDIKPENIMITKDGLIKLADLGLALEIHGDEEGTGQAGEDGKVKVMGTPRYMSPEQCRGKPVDHRTDQYCLGGTLFHMLTGHPPYEGKNRKDLMRAQVLEPVPDPAELIDLPEAWRQLLMRMMAKNPSDRVPDAETLLEAVRQAIAGQIFKPARRGIGASMRRSNQQSNNNVFLYLIIAVVLLATLGFMLSNSNEDPYNPSPNQNPPQEDPDDLEREKARRLVNQYAPKSRSSTQDLREAIKNIAGIKNQGLFKPGSPGQQIIDNELKRLEDNLIALADSLEQSLLRKIKNVKPLIISGKFNQANKELTEITPDQRIIVKKEYDAVKSEFNAQLDQRTKSFLASIERCKTPGEIDNVIKEARITQVYNFRKGIIDDAAKKRKVVAQKEQAIRQKEDAIANKREDKQNWKSLINDLNRHRGTSNFGAFIKAADEAQKRLHNDKLKAAAKSYADIGRQVQHLDGQLGRYLRQDKPSFILKDRGAKEVRCIGTKNDEYVILVSSPKETISRKRNHESIPIASFLNVTLKNRNLNQRNHLISVYMNYWEHPYAGQYRSPFPTLTKEFPINEYPQLESSTAPAIFDQKRFNVDFGNVGLWQPQFHGSHFTFANNKLTWTVVRGSAGNPRTDPETKLNLQTLAFAPKLNPELEVDMKIRIANSSFIMVGLRRANKLTRIVLNSSFNVAGGASTGANGVMVTRPKDVDPFSVEDIFDDAFRLRITMDDKSNIEFFLDGKSYHKFDGASRDKFSLPGKGPVQLVFQGIKFGSNGSVEILDLDIKQAQ